MSDSRFERVCERVQQEMERLPIPGVAVGVLCEGKEEAAGFRVTNVENPQPVTPETLYQIGSITKTFLGTLVMRLVELGNLDLQAPLKTYLPDLKLQDKYAEEHATLFHCLTHTGGWLGDYFNDFGRGDDALARMVYEMRNLPQLTPLGEVWSYNNAGFYLAGRVIEVVTDQPFEAAMQELVFEPLGLKDAYFFAEDVITHRTVAGHYKDTDGPVVAHPWALARTANPAGGIVTNLGELFRYARFHMRGGVTDDGTRLLSEAAVREMQMPRFDATDPEQVGLTWYMREVGGYKMIGHGGGTNGQITRFQVIPEKEMAFAILTNGDYGSVLITPVMNAILEIYLGVKPAAEQSLLLRAEELATYAGVYDAAEDRVEVKVSEGEVILQVTNKGGFPTPDSPPPPTQPPPARAMFYAPDKVVGLDEPYKGVRGQFLRDAEGKIVWLRLFGRVHRRMHDG